jgi:putative DNA primase/helicase
MMSLQFIDPPGGKMFMPNGRVECGHYVVGDLGKPGPLLIAEGYATAATLHELTGMPAIVAFNAGNLAPVAQTYRQLHPDRPIYIAGDNDHRREAEGKPNVGREKAEEAAAAIGAFVLLPAFAEQDAGSDWNDLARGQGKGAARQQLMAGIAIAEREQMVRSDGASRDEALSPSQAPALTHSRDRMQEVELER